MPALPNSYDKGDTVSMNALYFKKDGTLGDPTSAVLKIKDPSGLQTSHSPVRDSVGTYHFDLVTDLTDQAGLWEYRFEGTGAITSAEEKQFWLRETQFS